MRCLRVINLSEKEDLCCKVQVCFVQGSNACSYSDGRLVHEAPIYGHRGIVKWITTG